MIPTVAKAPLWQFVRRAIANPSGRIDEEAAAICFPEPAFHSIAETTMLKTLSGPSMPTNSHSVPPWYAAITGVTLAALLCLPVRGAEPSHMPVYKVLKEGYTTSEAEMLARRLGVSEPSLGAAQGGAVEFVDAGRYLAWPKETAAASVLDSKDLARALQATRNKNPTTAIAPALLNTRSLVSQRAIEESRALSLVTEALDKAGLVPQFGQPTVGHHQLSLYAKDGARKLTERDVDLDTEVAYRFTDPNGYPIFGPGAQAQVSLDAGGHASRMYFATRVLEPEGTVEIIPTREAEEQIARLLPPKARITMRLVYFSPSLATPEDESRVAVLIPWYAYYGTVTIGNSKNSAAREIKTRIGFIPATRDVRFVPRIKIEASGRSEVQASVAVEGGRPPYRYIWGGSNPRVLQEHGSVVRYMPRFRAERSLLADAHLRRERLEHVTVTVIDANGVRVSASQSLPVDASPIFPQTVAHRDGRDALTPTFGSENPGTPLKWVPAQAAWNQEMGTTGGGATLSFNWGGDDAWPGDFIRPTPAGSLVGTPWVNGDADFANWGIDTADIVLDNADGAPDATALMYPGAADTDYNTANGGAIFSPISSPDVQIGSQSFTVTYNGSWGPVGPNDTLEWLLLDDCEMLDALDGANLNVAQRWGPAFGGLHVLTGFASLGTGNGAFEGGVADRVLGVNGQAAQSIVQAWFNSASATGAGTAAAMGPALELLPGLFVSDFNDFFWGKGPVGPTIVPNDFSASLVAFWYLTSTTPIQYLF